MRPEPEPLDTIEPASRIAQIAVAAFALLLIALALSINPLLDRLGTWATEDPQRALERVETLVAWLAVISLPLLVAGVFTCRSGLRSIAAERFPPPGMWLIVDTRIETGSRARFRGRMLVLGGVVMSVTAVSVPAVLWYIVRSIGGTA